MSNSAYDIFLDRELEEYYSDDEDEQMKQDDESKLDMYIESLENYDEYEGF